MVKVLGVSASLRNARFGMDSQPFCDEIRAIKSESGLTDYLTDQTRLRAADFIGAGREEGLRFDQIYERLQKLKGEQGLSNSEAVLAAGLWGALREGAEIDHLPLSYFFPANGRTRDREQLKNRILQADAILLSGPVYFGDRGSLAQAFVEFITADEEIRSHLVGKVYGGIAVGAKRNGGQETTLIYQLVDMVNFNMLGVGNDSDTTSQYGGTAVGGDVGTVHSDSYGIKTSIGTGARVARVAMNLERAIGKVLNEPVKIDVWLLQDTPDSRGLAYYQKWVDAVRSHDKDVVIRVRDLTQEDVYRCIACDLCPTDLGDQDDYRCIVTSRKDLFAREHSSFLIPDAVLLAAYSPRNRTNINSIYQSFIERTRYWRRDNYILGDRLWAPFIISEISANQNLHIRMLTSAVRHHTVLHHPLIGMEMNDALLNEADIIAQGLSFIHEARRVTIGHSIEGGRVDISYKPLGYHWSLEKNRAQRESGEIEHYVSRNLHSRIKSVRRASKV